MHAGEFIYTVKAKFVIRQFTCFTDLTFDLHKNLGALCVIDLGTGTNNFRA